MVNKMAILILGMGMMMALVMGLFMGMMLAIVTFIPFIPLAWFINWFKSFTIETHIFEQRGSNIMINKDFSKRLFNPPNEEQYQLRGKRHKTQPQDYTSIYIDNTGKQYLYMESSSPTEYRPLSLDEVKRYPGLTPKDEFMKAWHSIEYQKLHERWAKKGWLQLMPIIIMLLLIVGGMLISYVNIQGAKDISEKNAGVASALAETSKNQIESNKIMMAMLNKAGIQIPSTTGTGGSLTPPPY